MVIQQGIHGLRELALFAGAGGGILGGKLLGWRTVCAVERDAYAAQVLAQRQNDGILAPFPIWSDVESFDGKPWRGIVDVVSGGFPCQDISVAGKGAGITGERSGLWKEFARIIGEVEPGFVFVENSPMLTIRGLGVVLGDLASLGFDAEWGVLGADDVGAPHRRDRIWIMAHSNCSRWQKSDSAAVTTQSRQYCGSFIETETVAYAGEQQRNGRSDGPSWWEREPQEAVRDVRGRGGEEDGVSIPKSELGRVAYGLAFTLDRLKAIGNGQVPLCAATAFRLLAERAGVDL